MNTIITLFFPLFFSHQMTSITTATASSISATTFTAASLSSSSAHFFIVIGGGNYITNYHQKAQPASNQKFDPELYYPNACLFCGFPNGQLITTSSLAVETITNAPTAMHYYNSKQQQPVKRRELPAATTAASEATPLGKHFLPRMKKTLKRFIIKIQIYIFSTMMNNKKRIS
jgi:hypothetical protein